MAWLNWYLINDLVPRLISEKAYVSWGQMRIFIKNKPIKEDIIIDKLVVDWFIAGKLSCKLTFLNSCEDTIKIDVAYTQKESYMKRYLWIQTAFSFIVHIRKVHEIRCVYVHIPCPVWCKHKSFNFEKEQVIKLCWNKRIKQFVLHACIVIKITIINRRVLTLNSIRHALCLIVNVI